MGKTNSRSIQISGGSGAATILGDSLPEVTVGGTWFQPNKGELAVGVDDSWVQVNKAGKDGIDGLDGADKVATTGTGTAIPLNELGGYYGNMSAANSATTYTTTSNTLGCFACIRINVATEPTVTGGTKIKGSDFIASTDMHLWIQYFGVTVQYFFLEL